jgi:energy-coupling factor transport system substrate-specific component
VNRQNATLILALGIGLVAFMWPVFLADQSAMSPAQAPLVFALVLPLLLAVVLAELTSGGLDAKALAMLGVLAAIGTVLRPLSAGTAGFDLIFFLFILAGRVYGANFGFALGAITLFTSALLTGGVGPWLPYQMLASGAVGAFAGWLPRARGKAELAILAGYGVVAGFAFGWLMDLVFWPYSLGAQTELSYDPSLGVLSNLQRFVLFNLATSMGWNLGRAVANAALVLIVGTPLLRMLRRAARRPSFIIEPVA